MSLSISIASLVAKLGRLLILSLVHPLRRVTFSRGYQHELVAESAESMRVEEMVNAGSIANLAAGVFLS